MRSAMRICGDLFCTSSKSTIAPAPRAAFGSWGRCRTLRRRFAPSASASPSRKVAGVLGSFTAGLAGRHLKLQVGDEVFTDTEVIHLPERLTHFQDRPGNYRLYKAMIAHQWAQVWFGTWRVPVVERLQRFPDPARALSLFHALECICLDTCLARELPGLWREMKRLDDPPRGLAQGPLWREAEHGLGAADVGVERTWAEVERFYPSAGVLPKACYQGVLRPEKVAAVLARRAERSRRCWR
jgi:nitric oxide reductase NorD protein